jgi:hypothetical protein
MLKAIKYVDEKQTNLCMKEEKDIRICTGFSIVNHKKK